MKVAGRAWEAVCVWRTFPTPVNVCDVRGLLGVPSGAILGLSSYAIWLFFIYCSSRACVTGNFLITPPDRENKKK